MATLEERLLSLSPYKVGCRFVDGFVLVNVTYDEDWSVVTPENTDIAYMQKGENLHLYCADPNKASINDIFDAIEVTVNYNMELQSKADLLKIKVEELYNLFATEDLDTLKTLEFKTKRKKKQNKEKSQMKKVEEAEEKEIEEKIDEIIEDDDVVYTEYNEENRRPVEQLVEIDR